MVSVLKMTVTLLALLLLLAGGAGAAQPYNLDLGDDYEVGELQLAIGKSRIVTTPADLKQVVVGNTGVADVRLLSSRRVLLLGKSQGRTNLAFRDKQDNVIALLDLVVVYDIEGLKRKLHEVLPRETGIEVRSSNAAVLLSGEVSNVMTLDTALTIARSFASDDSVKNMLQVGGGQQVMLEVRIAEIKRSALKTLGINSLLSGSSEDFPLTLITGTPIPGAFVDATLSWSDLLLNLQALESKGAAKTLAEPNIVALSGQQASFLVGGEFPVPVVQSGTSNAITIEYKDFGVGLEFTPTVLSSQKINLQLQTEVSTIDTENTVILASTSIPALATRRAGTTIELADGQSFAIAGLLQNDMDNSISQFPGLGNLPVLGSLFRSTEFQRNETELAIVVRPQLVKPGPAGSIKLPTDSFIPPTDIDQYLLGNLEGVPPMSEDQQNDADVDAAEGGLEGSYGHQL